MIKSLCCASFSFKLNISAQVKKDSSLTIQAEQKFWDSIKKIKWENLIVLKAESAISSSKSASLFKTMSRRLFFYPIRAAELADYETSAGRVGVGSSQDESVQSGSKHSWGPNETELE